jgi:hypothetical protein
MASLDASRSRLFAAMAARKLTGEGACGCGAVGAQILMSCSIPACAREVKSAES